MNTTTASAALGTPSANGVLPLVAPEQRYMQI